MNVTYEPLNHPFTINGFGSGKTTPLGSFQATLMVDRAKANVKVYVVRDAVQVVPLLVGQFFTEQPHVTVVRRKIARTPYAFLKSVTRLMMRTGLWQILRYRSCLHDA